MEGYLGGDDPARGREGDARGDVAELADQLPPLRRAGRDLRPARPASTAGWAARCTPSSPPFGIYPNNAIVGGSADIATGAALFKRVNRKPGIVVANIGDASFGCGPVWEGMMLRHHGPVPHAVGRGARRRPADHLQLHEQLLRHGRPAHAARRWASACSPASARASTPSRCTPSAWTATTRWPWSTPSRARSEILARGPRPGAARHRHLPHLAATRPPTPPATAPRRRSSCWQAADAIVGYGQLPGRERRHAGERDLDGRPRGAIEPACSRC